MGSGGGGIVASNGTGSRYVWSDKPYSAGLVTSSSSNSVTCRSNNAVAAVSKLLDMEDDEKDIENGMLEISKKLANELVDDDFATC